VDTLALLNLALPHPKPPKLWNKVSRPVKVGK
jgi:hypothetical protein